MNTVDQKRLAARVRALILQPSAEWAVIDREPATVRGLFTGYVMILAAVPPVCATLGRLIFGYSGVARDLHPTVIGQAAAGVVSYVLSLCGVYLMALIIEAAAPRFGGLKDRTQALKVAAYFPTAAWLAGAFALVPGLAALSVLGLYSLYLLYRGLPRLMRVAPDSAMVFTLVIIVAALVVQILIASLAGATGLSLLPATL